MDIGNGDPCPRMHLLQPEQGQDTGAVHVGNPGQIDRDRPGRRIVQAGFHLGEEAIRIAQRDPSGERKSQFLAIPPCSKA